MFLAIYLVELMSLKVLVILHFVRSRFKCRSFHATLLTALRTVYTIGQTSSGLSSARPSFDPPCGSHQLPVILKCDPPRENRAKHDSTLTTGFHLEIKEFYFSTLKACSGAHFIGKVFCLVGHTKNNKASTH